MATRGEEIKIALVLYGGVSLAVYIYGVVVEVQRLLAAAAELEEGKAESAYAQALKESGASTVTVDVISGTSAGGINGILLAKALARGADVSSARDLWIDHGDIGQLLQPPSLRVPRSLLRSRHFEEAVCSGLARFDEEAGEGGVKRAPVLDLFVSSTHLRGGKRAATDSLGHEISTRQHRYVFRLKLRREEKRRGGLLGYERDDFENNARLVRVARATSAFPVAFEPVRVPRSDDLFDHPEDVDGWFADGGILNNKPFTEAVDAVVSRRSTRPVRRWLFSLDPDPKPETKRLDAGPQPPFDQVALNAVTTVPRYQSIARDLVALTRHNQKVDAAAQAIVAGEAELADAPVGDGEGSLGPGLDATYATLRRQAWAKEVAGVLIPDPEGAEDAQGAGSRPTDWDQMHRALRAGVEAPLESWELGREPDLAFQRRRVYYLIKLLRLATEVRSGDPDEVRAALWFEFEAISATLWDAFGRRSVHPPPRSFAGRAELSRRALAEVAEGLLEAEAISEFRLGAALENVILELDHEGQGFPVALGDVFAGFSRRDALLLSAELFGGLEQGERVEFAQIGPLDAENTGIDEKKKLAGVSLGHFGGFLDPGWRENDIAWGRLDGAEVFMRAILDGSDAKPVRAFTDAVQEEVLAEELPHVLEHVDGWRAGLAAHVGDGPSLGDLDSRKLVGLGLRAAGVLRWMLRTAARDDAGGEVAKRARAKVLRGTANLLGFVLALLFLPVTAAFGRAALGLRIAIGLTLLVTLWGVTTTALGAIGVLPFDDVVVPAAVAIAAYPALVLGCWLVSLLAWLLKWRWRRALRR